MRSQAVPSVARAVAPLVATRARRPRAPPPMSPAALRSVRARAAVGLLVALTAAGCAAPDAVAPDMPGGGTAVAPSRSVAADTPRLLACSDATVKQTSALIGANGGVLDLGATRVDFPKSAVLDLRGFTLAVRPGQQAAVDVHADGLESFVFEQPITVTIDLSHCPKINDELTVWHVDAETGAFLENMGGVTDAARRTITFQTPHLSIYAVAN